MSPASKAQQKAVAKYMKSNYDEIKIRVAKVQKEIIKQHADKHDKSLNGFIVDAIVEQIKKDSN